jgi:hypothetical protein
MRVKFIIIYIACLSIVSGCAVEEESPSAEHVLSIPAVNNQWTYISLSNNSVLGSCALGDSVKEKQWFTRLDWDIAVCNGIIKTNSGTSGLGLGGVKTMSEKDYSIDTDTMSIW